VATEGGQPDTCGGCRFSVMVEDSLDCRRYAPRGSVLPVITEDMLTVTTWPTVEGDDPACGEYEPGDTSEKGGTE